LRGVGELEQYDGAPNPSLGFIIDDMPAGSPAVDGDGTHVDLYGYSTMLLATVKEQQKQIDALQKQVDELKKKR